MQACRKSERDANEVLNKKIYFFNVLNYSCKMTKLKIKITMSVV